MVIMKISHLEKNNLFIKKTFCKNKSGKKNIRQKKFSKKKFHRKKKFRQKKPPKIPHFWVKMKKFRKKNSAKKIFFSELNQIPKWKSAF